MVRASSWGGVEVVWLVWFDLAGLVDIAGAGGI